MVAIVVVETVEFACVGGESGLVYSFSDLEMGTGHGCLLLNRVVMSLQS